MQQLQRAGAKVYLARGDDQAAKKLFGPGACGGFMHQKAIVLDREVAYVGSANCTRQARCNRELITRISGLPAVAIAEAVEATIAGSCAAKV